MPSTGEFRCCYNTLGEVRIASYIGIAKGEMPRKHYFGAWRTFPDSCDWSWQQMKPEGEWRTYLGQDVFEWVSQDRLTGNGIAQAAIMSRRSALIRRWSR